MTRHPTWTRACTALAASALLTLAACGGGGGGSDSPSTPPGASLSGVASKGLLLNALVTVKRIASDGSQTVIATTTTDSQGRYQVANLPKGALILVEVSATSATTLVDEASNTTITPPPGFTLRAAVKLEDTTVASSNTLQVTPFSEMAVARAESAAGGLKAGNTNVDDANREVRDALGFDVLAEEPKFEDGGKKPTNTAALWLAAVSQLAQSSGTVGCSPVDDVGTNVDCVVKKLAEKGFTDATLVTQLDNAKTTAITQESYAGAVPTAPKPQPETLVTTEGRTAIQNAKALIASIRGNVQPLKNLQTALLQVQSALQVATNPVSASQRGLVASLLASVAELDGYAKGLHTGTLAHPADTVILPQVPDTLWTFCTVYTDNFYAQEATTYENADYLVCRATYAEQYNVEDNTYTEFQHQFFVAPTGTPGQYTVTARIVEQKYDGDDWFLQVGEPVVKGSEAHATIALTRNGNQALTSASLLGDLPAPIYSEGQYGTGLVGVDLSAVPTTVSGVTKLALTGVFTQKDGEGQATGQLGLKAGSYVQARLVTPNDPGSGVVDNSASAGQFILEASAAGNVANGSLSFGTYGTTKDGAPLPTKATFIGKITKAGSDLFVGQVDATVTSLSQFDRAQKEGVGNFLPKTLGITGTLSAPGAAPLSLTVNLTEASFGQFSLVGGFTQGSTAVNVQGSGTRAGGAASVSLSSSAGVGFVLTKGATEVDLKTNGSVVIGILDLDQGVIHYADGSLESF